jgi:OHCU decarboxylase
VLNSFPYTCFAENVGLVRLTAIKSRWVVATAGLFMIIVGLIPKAGAVAASIPHSVLGGAAIAMFATVAVVGIQMLGRVDFNDHRNVVIVATSLGLAMLVVMKPTLYEVVPGGRWSEMFFNSGITLGALTAILLNIVFFHVGKSYGPAVAGSPGQGVVRLDQVNAMDRATFAETFEGLFQGNRFAVEGAYAQRPFADTPALREAMQDALFSLNPEQQDELLNSFPQLGADDLERAESRRDQSVLGLDRLNDDDYAEFAEMNQAYREKFGFPLIVAVRTLSKRHDVLEQGWARMEHAPNQERATALIEVGKIVDHRFDDLLSGANPIHTARTDRFEQIGH